MRRTSRRSISTAFGLFCFGALTSRTGFDASTPISMRYAANECGADRYFRFMAPLIARAGAFASRRVGATSLCLRFCTSAVRVANHLATVDAVK